MNAPNPTRYAVDLDRVTWRPLDLDIVVFDVVDGSIRVLVGPAAVIWELLLDGATIEMLGDAVCGEFDVAHEVALADAATFIDEAVAEGMVRVVSPGQ